MDEVDRLIELKGEMTDEQFGEVIGYSRKTVNAFVNRQRKLTPRVYTGISAKYGPDVAEYVRSGRKVKLPPAIDRKIERDREKAMQMLEGLDTEELKKVLEYARLLKADKQRPRE